MSNAIPAEMRSRRGVLPAVLAEKISTFVQLSPNGPVLQVFCLVHPLSLKRIAARTAGLRLTAETRLHWRTKKPPVIPDRWQRNLQPEQAHPAVVQNIGTVDVGTKWRSMMPPATPELGVFL